MAELPIMPVKTDALLGDTAHLSPEEFGAYCRILFTMWRHGARLPDKDSELARIVGMTERRWKSLRETILRPMTTGGGLLSQKRLTDTWIDVQEHRANRAKAAAAKWAKSKPPGRSNGHAMHEQSMGNQNQTNNLSFNEED